MKSGIELIAEERQRHIDKEGYTDSHDDEHDKDEIAIAAACYAMPKRKRKYVKKWKCLAQYVPKKWPWDFRDWKETPDDRIRELVKAGALIAAEIDRLQRIP